MPIRRSNRSYNIAGHAHELTFSCFQRLPLLNKDQSRQWFVQALDKARHRRQFLLWAYVIMPEHVHIVIWPTEQQYEMRLIRTALKTPVQRKALAYLRHYAPGFLERLKDRQPNGKIHYRFWQRGGGYDRNIVEPETVRTMIDYIHNNPVRRGLVSQPTDWPWSSARFYAGMADVPILMDAMAEFIG
jgi:putative transposase